MTVRAQRIQIASIMAKESWLSTKNHLPFIYIVVALLDNLGYIKTMQKYFMFVHKMELGSGSH